MTAPQLGDVALAKYPGDVPKVYMYQRDFGSGRERWVSSIGTTSDRFESAEWHRPLAVIDPEDREQVERLHRLRREADGQRVERTQNALREFAKPTPPRPAEPTALGAVVLDRDGSELVRVQRSGRRPWQAEGGHRFSWDEIDFLAEVGPGSEQLADWEIDLLRGAR